LVKQAFEGKAHEYIVSFMLLLCDRGYFSYMTGCIDTFKKRYFENFNISQGIVVSAYPLNDEEKEKLQKALEVKANGRKIILNFSVDESLIGGFFVEMDGKVIDSTLKKKLSGLKDILSKPQ
jgi:F-type H+-transporting ATPase subunit delta